MSKLIMYRKVPVTERLPKHRGDYEVLIATGDETKRAVARFDRLDGKRTFYSTGVTHWYEYVENVPREIVIWFAGLMEAKLTENDHKGGWGECSLSYLKRRLTQEKAELWRAIETGDVERIKKEAADVANFALMIADNFNQAIYQDV